MNCRPWVKNERANARECANSREFAFARAKKVRRGWDLKSELKFENLNLLKFLYTLFIKLIDFD